MLSFYHHKIKLVSGGVEEVIRPVSPFLSSCDIMG
jgi:hypothetical protein